MPSKNPQRRYMSKRDFAGGNSSGLRFLTYCKANLESIRDGALTKSQTHWSNRDEI